MLPAATRYTLTVSETLEEKNETKSSSGHDRGIRAGGGGLQLAGYSRGGRQGAEGSGSAVGERYRDQRSREMGCVLHRRRVVPSTGQSDRDRQGSAARLDQEPGERSELCANVS